MSQFADGREIADEGRAGPPGQRDPQEMLGDLQPRLVPGPGRLVQADAGHAVAFDLALDPHEDLGVDGLRTGVAAEQPAGHGGEQEQRQRRDHQQHRQVDHVLRPQHQAEQVELARAQVEQHGLAAIPLQPGQAVEDELGQKDEGDAPAREQAADGSRVDLAAHAGQGLFQRCLAGTRRPHMRPPGRRIAAGRRADGCG